MRNVLTLIAVALTITMLLPDDLMAQGRGRGGRGRGGGNRGGAGRANPNGPPRPGQDREERETSTPVSPVREQRELLVWIEAEVTKVDDNAKDPVVELVKSKSKKGFPSLVVIPHPSQKGRTWERKVFDEEKIVLSAPFYSFMRISLEPTLPKELRDHYVKGKKATVLLFDPTGKEVKRLHGWPSAAAVFKALAPPVKSSHGVTLRSFIKKERKLLADLDKAFATLDQHKRKMDDLSQQKGNSARRRMEELQEKIRKVNDKIETLTAKEKEHMSSWHKHK